ncbi:hypothetical protein GIB67_005304 [Kingdonia uniflora]|uniref:PLAT domain-containing protein n=1 Tax=Kingdonia uniflora TaxID=39325 RepID=A0A7J7LCU8_9MAGN|nr:hypothetical protein GIB67_005304 [Kingdonia uniflora]
MSRRCFSLILLAFFVSTATGSDNSDDCVYTFYVRTGSILKAGTDSKISVTLGDKAAKSVIIPDLEKGGLMGPGYDYFERSNLDIFTIKAPCIGAPICRINVTSDGTGPHHGWYCEYIEVTLTGAHKDCSQTIFYVQQWLATDVSPYQLTALLDGCSQMTKMVGHGTKGPLVVGNNHQGGASSSM